ncbi:MAG: alkaline phosphatase, partial [Myxococcota bacterium]
MLPLLALAACTRYTPATPDDPPLPGDDTGDSAPTSPGPAPAVVLFVGDGMGFEHVAGGSLHVTGERGGLTMETAPHQGRVRTASLSGVTDSAAAATALASGHKTWNDVVGLDADGLAVESIVERARAG